MDLESAGSVTRLEGGVVMRRFVTNWVLAGAMAVGFATTATAVPITSYPQPLFFPDGSVVPGTITTTFDLYTRPYGGGAFGCCAPTGPATLLHQFSVGIGSDFWVHIPSITDPFSSWEMSIPTGSSGLA